MRFLGAGRCSAVFALSDEARDGEALEQCGTVPPRLLRHVALRVSRATTAECPTCCQALVDFVGFRHEVRLTDSLRAYCAAAYPLLAEHCGAAVQAHLIPNYALSPAALFNGSGCVSGGEGKTRWAAVEIKPKGVWRPPRVVGIVVDGVEHYLHPVKLQQCRFSLMHVLKHERQNKGATRLNVPGNAYCPNELFLGDQLSVAAALLHLQRNPANNFRTIDPDGFADELGEGELSLVAAALHRSGVLPILTNLQQYGSGTSFDWEVLDAELLFPWSTACDASSVRWIVLDFHSPWDGSGDCACQSGIHDKLQRGELRSADRCTTRQVVPPVSLEECVDRFYASTTAKDASVVVALSTIEGGTPPGGGRESTGASLWGQVEIAQWKSCYGGVVVDFGFPAEGVCRVGVVDVDAKRHKPLSHYFALDQEVLAAWDRCKVAVAAPCRYAAVDMR